MRSLTMKPTAVCATAALAFAIFPLHAQSHQTKKDIVETAGDARKFTEFLKVVQSAELTATLKGPGPFTLFAPTDHAFAKLPKRELDQLLASPEKLRQVVTYHVIAGKHSSEEVKKMGTVKSLEGTPLRIRDVNGKITINSATLVNPDIECTNGVIHVIDGVLIPK
jgi:uncharacterized surface protein with fasciclin (FAS1) repeats